MHGRVEERHRAPLGLLGPVHRGVGVAEHVLGAGVTDRAGRDAEAGADGELMAVEVDDLGQARLDPLGDGRSTASCSDVVEQDRELVAAEPGAGVHLAQLTA